jgi:hypothetical protein
MQGIDFKGVHVIPTEGMVDGATGQQLYGLFATEADARSENADELAIGTVAVGALTPNQRAIARANSAEIGEN